MALYMLRMHALAWGVIACAAIGCGSSGDSGPQEVAGSAGQAGSAGSGSDAGQPQSVGCEGCTSFVGGTVFDGTKSGLGTVVVRGDKVEQVAWGQVTVSAGASVDLTGKTILPGLIDLHVHLPAQSGPYGWYSASEVSPDHLKAMLRSGVTSMLDAGTSEHVIFTWRSRLADGKMMGPRLFAAGPMLTPTGGHPCTAGSPPGDACFFVDSPADAQKAVDHLTPMHPDLIKVIIESGFSWNPLPQLSDASLAAVGQAAEAAGLQVYAHVSEASDMTAALDAGIRRFAHTPQADVIPQALAQRLAQEQAVVVSTAVVIDSMWRLSKGQMNELGDPALADDVPQEVIDALGDPQLLGEMTSAQTQEFYGKMRDTMLQNVKVCHEAGVKLAAGTDAGNPGTFHGLAMRRELELYVEAGLTPVEALQTATRNASEMIGHSEIGRLEPGAQADLLIVQGDATADIRAIAKVDQVYLAGKAIDRASLALGKATSLVLQTVQGIAQSETCLGPEECAAGLVCEPGNTCAPSCSNSVACAAQSACFPLTDTGTEGYCMKGDGCDLLLQTCVNGAACVWLGNGATVCWYAGEGKDGEACSSMGTCAPGYTCNYYKNICLKMCDPKATDGCPSGKTCLDLTAQAGLSIGQCQ